MEKIEIPKRKIREEVDDKKPRVPNTKASRKSPTKVARTKTTKSSAKTKTKSVSKVVSEKKVEEEKFDVRKVLPKGYKPEVLKFGKNEGYMYVPRSIFDWIDTNKYEWHKMIDEFPFYRDVDIVRSLLYYILLDGYVYLQENRYEKFYKLKISEE